GTPGDIADIDACPHLQQPDRHTAAQAWRNILGDHNQKAHDCVRCPTSPMLSAFGMAGGTDSGGASGGDIPPAASTSSMVGMIFPRSLVERNRSRQPKRTSRSGCGGALAAMRKASGTTVSNLNRSAIS